MQHLRFSFLMTILATLLSAQTARDISARDLIAFPSIRNLELNAENGIMVYEVRETDLDANARRTHLWIMNIDGSNPRQLTYSSKNEWGSKISPAGDQIAFYSNRPDDSGEAGTRIWILPLGNGEAYSLTDKDQSIIDFKWSHLGDQIYYLSTQNKPDQTQTWKASRKKLGFDAKDLTADKPNIELWAIDLNSGEAHRRFVGDPGVSAFDVDVSGNNLVYSTNYTGDENDWVETDLYLFSIRDSLPIKQLTSFKGSEEMPIFSPSGNLIAYIHPQDTKKPFSQIELEIINPVDLKVKRLTKKLDLTIGTFKWYTDQNLLLEVSQGMNNHLYLVGTDGNHNSLTGGASYFYRSSVQYDSPLIAAVRQNPTSIDEIFISQGPGRPWEQLSHQSDALENLNIHPQTSFWWTSRDERYHLQGLVVIPHFSGDKPLPLIVDIHGGPAARTDISLEQYALYQAWASEGFAVFSPNFRGSEGYGASFQTANYQDLGGGDYHDIMAGVKALIQRGVAHPDSLVIMGGSYGGFMTNWVITQTNQFKAAVSRYGIFDLRGDFSNSIYAQWELDYLGKPYWEDPSLYRRLSPSTFIKRAKTPTLILHGSNDVNTFVSNSRELARALKTLDVPHRFFLYPREGHGMKEPNHRLDVFNRQLSWVNHHLKRGSVVSGEDWLSSKLRVQILSLDREAIFQNAPGESFLRVKVLLDGSNLDSELSFDLSDISLESGNVQVVGLPSGQFLAPVQDFQIKMRDELQTVELELVFPAQENPEPTLLIRGIGRYKLSN